MSIPSFAVDSLHFSGSPQRIQRREATHMLASAVWTTKVVRRVLSQEVLLWYNAPRLQHIHLHRIVTNIARIFGYCLDITTEISRLIVIGIAV